MRSLEEPDAHRASCAVDSTGCRDARRTLAWYATTRSAPSDAQGDDALAGTARTDVPSSGNEPATAAAGTRRGHECGAACRPARRADRPPGPPRGDRRQHRRRASSRVTTDVPAHTCSWTASSWARRRSCHANVGSRPIPVERAGRRTPSRGADRRRPRRYTHHSASSRSSPAAQTSEARSAIDTAVAVVSRISVGSCEGTLEPPGTS